MRLVKLLVRTKMDKDRLFDLLKQSIIQRMLLGDADDAFMEDYGDMLEEWSRQTIEEIEELITKDGGDCHEK